VQIWISGKPGELADGARVPDALTLLGVPDTGVAIAFDGAVVPRAAWPDTVLTDGAHASATRTTSR
jgi:sulfur carrier protein